MIDSPRHFYLGKEYDLYNKKILDTFYNYDSKDLKTHAVALGMTGSGKTGLCTTLIEEAALDGIPAILIDPKGDMGNLALTFPKLSKEEFLPWVSESEAKNKDMSKEEFAENVSSKWQSGLKLWQRDKAIKQFHEKVDVKIYTPGSDNGIPVSLLSGLRFPGKEIFADSEQFSELIENTTSSLCTLMDIDPDPIQSTEHILISKIFEFIWTKEKDLSLESLIAYIITPPFEKIGMLSLDDHMNEKDRKKLAMKMNNIIAAPGFKRWLKGVDLDPQKLFYDPETGKAQIAIMNIAHLSDQERMFFTSLLLNQCLGWMRKQSGTESLRALLYMDEIFGYIPPSQNPPTKKPLLTLLKQGRAFGLGIVLATQNPVDLDYKALSNIGTWFLGRLQTERDKARVIEGLKSLDEDAEWSAKDIDQALSAIESRVFLVKNIHQGAPKTFHVRWAMSYLKGPLEKKEIRQLTKKYKLKTTKEKLGKDQGSPNTEMPFHGEQYFLASKEHNGDNLVYVPALVAKIDALIKNDKPKVKENVNVCAITKLNRKNPLGEWNKTIDGISWSNLTDTEIPGAKKSSLPKECYQVDYIDSTKKNITNWLEDGMNIELWLSPSTNIVSKPGESEANFRARLENESRTKRDANVDKVKAKFDKELKSLETKLEKAYQKIAKEEAQSKNAKLNAAIGFGSALLSAFVGQKKMSVGNLSRTATATKRANKAWKEKQDVDLAEENAAKLEEMVKDKKLEIETELQKISSADFFQKEELKSLDLKPDSKKSKLEEVALVWLPYEKISDFELEKAW